jgi:hypothetical protein
VRIEGIDLWLLGGVARMSGPHKPAGDELSFALAGPVVTAMVAAIFGALALALPTSTPAALRAAVSYQAEINLLILGLNLVPARRWAGRPRTGVLLTFNGAPGGLWFALIGVVAANAERFHEQVVTTFRGTHAQELMSQPVISIPSDLTAEQAMQYFRALPLHRLPGHRRGRPSRRHAQNRSARAEASWRRVRRRSRRP